LSQPQIAETLNRLRQPFNVNSVALAAATVALDDTQHVERTIALNRAGREQLRTGLQALGLKVVPSAANFVLVDLGGPSGPVYEGLLRHGVIARPLGNYGLANHLRITTGTAEQNRRTLEALAAILGRRA
jgi:histidinol-phosphate aminotransferase